MIKTFLLISLVCISYLHAETITIHGVKATVSASSTLSSKKKGAYSVKNLFDYNSKTAWVEGVKGPGIGESITIEFEKPILASAIILEPGYRKSLKTFRENALPTEIAIEIDDTVGYGKLKYIPGPMQDDIRAVSNKNLTTQYLFLNEKKTLKKIKIEIVSTTKENKYNDLALSGIQIINDKSNRLHTIADGLRMSKNTAIEIPFVYKKYQSKKCIPEEKWSIWKNYYSQFKNKVNNHKKYNDYLFKSKSASLNQSLFAVIPLDCDENKFFIMGDERFDIMTIPENGHPEDGQNISFYLYFTMDVSTPSLLVPSILVEESALDDYAPYTFSYYPYYFNKQ